MKKLKKGLSLLLVLAMVFSLASTAFAWETNYEDDDQIVQKEAVEVLSAMGIIEGDNGKFDPTGNFTREQAAKIVTYMVLGPDTAESLQITANDFSDVAATRWSAKYIAYAASQEIVMGDGNGKFRPADNVSRIEWLKMLLVSLGVDPDEEGLGDDPNWAANTQSFAVRSGLVTGKELALDWNRDTAVLYAFNAMQLAQEESWGDNYLNSTNDKNYKWIRQYAPTLEKKSSTDDFGRQNYSWVDDKTLPANKITVYASGNNDLVTSYENQSVKVETILDDLDLGTTVAAIEVYVDGVKTTVDLDLDTDTYPSELGGKGATIEVYPTGNGEANPQYRVIVVEPHVAVAEAVTAGAKTTIYVDGKVVKDSSVKEDDVVLYTTAAGKVQSVQVLEGTDIKVTANGTDMDGTYVRINGEKTYQMLNGTYDADDEDCVATYGAFATAKVYYDTYGNIAFYGSTTAFNKTVDGYLYVKSAQSQADTTSSDILNGAEAKAKLKVLDLTTGTESVVNQAIAKKGDSWYYANKYGAAMDSNAKVGATSNNNLDTAGNAIAEGFYGYYLLDDGSYVLEPLAATATAATPAGTQAKVTSASTVITNKNTAVVNETSTLGYADANTTLTYLVKKGPAYTVTTVTGIANFPKLVGDTDATLAKNLLVITNSKNRITSIVVLDPETEVDDTADPNVYGVLTAAGDITVDEATGKYSYAYTFSVNGTPTEYVYDQDLADGTTWGAIENTVYKIENDGKLTLTSVDATAFNTSEYVVEVTQIADSYIVVADSTGAEEVVYLDANFQKYDASMAHKGLVKGAYVTVYKSAITTKAIAVVVTEAPAGDVE